MVEGGISQEKMGEKRKEGGTHYQTDGLGTQGERVEVSYSTYILHIYSFCYYHVGLVYTPPGSEFRVISIHNVSLATTSTSLTLTSHK